MNENGFASKQEELAWRKALYLEMVQDEGIRLLAWQIAQGLRRPGDPPLSPADLETSKRYMETIIMRRDVQDLGAMDDRAFAALWARGIDGAARFYANRSARSTIDSRTGSRPERRRKRDESEE